MPRMIVVALTVVFCAVLLGPTAARADKITYVDAYKYPVFTEMEAYADSVQAERDSVTNEIHARQKERKETDEKQQKTLLLDFVNITIPGSPEVFDAVFHTPPVAQYLSGTCWAFAGMSLIESEAERLLGRKIKLSEMFIVYWEWIERARRFVAERGDSRIGSGSETNAVFRVLKKYGAVPLEAYPGLPDPAYRRHNHNALSEELHSYFAFVQDKGLWDEDHVISMIKVILNKHLGTPPDSFSWEGKTFTPRAFADEYLGINPDDYVSVMSTLSVPFYTQAEFKAYDNWWHDSSYYNVPLDVWYTSLREAVRKGYSLTIGGDVSEPGVNGFVDAEVVADYDIPQKFINQDSREFRIYDGTTGDDHGVHVVGYTKIAGRDWYLTKDSSSRARFGKHEGYMFIRDDFIRLKILTYTVHKAALGRILNQCVGTTN